VEAVSQLLLPHRVIFVDAQKRWSTVPDHQRWLKRHQSFGLPGCFGACFHFFSGVDSCHVVNYDVGTVAPLIDHKAAGIIHSCKFSMLPVLVRVLFGSWSPKPWTTASVMLSERPHAHTCPLTQWVTHLESTPYQRRQSKRARKRCTVCKKRATPDGGPHLGPRPITVGASVCTLDMLLSFLQETAYQQPTRFRTCTPLMKL